MEINKKPHNPDAFPNQTIDWRESSIQCRTVYESQENGMTLRDYFANSAMQIATPPSIYVGEKETEKSFEDFAIYCYKIADAMLKQREL